MDAECGDRDAAMDWGGFDGLFNPIVDPNDWDTTPSFPGNLGILLNSGVARVLRQLSSS